MASRDKTFPEKLKNLFKTIKGTPPKPKDEYLILTEELEGQISPEATLANRLKGIKELTELCKTRKAEMHVIEKIWTLVNDLFRYKDGAAPTKETRHLTFNLLISLSQSPLEKMGAMRAKLFDFVKCHDNPEDILPKFHLLQSLTTNGKDVSYFEERIGPLLHDWIVNKQAKDIPVGEFMSFLINVIKFNYTFLDQDILLEIIENVCVVSCTCSSRDDVEECLNVLNVVLGYGKLPPGCLPDFLATLCRTVNIESLCQSSWRIMKNLLGTHLGHSGVYTMCNFMENSDRSDEFKVDVSVVRGAVFFVGTSLWGTKTIRSLKYSTNSVLNSLIRALDRKHTLVTFEVILRTQDLVKFNCDGQQTITWDLILQIISKVLNYATTDCLKEDQSAQLKIMKAVNDTLDSIENILHTKSFVGQIDQFYQLVDSCYLHRPIASVEKLMKYKVSTQLHTAKPNWFKSLVEFADKHLRQEHRPVAKAKAMPLITRICLANRDIYEEDLILKVILPHMRNLDCDPNPSVRVSGVNFLVDFLMESSSKKAHDLLSILDKILQRPYEIHAQTAPDTVHIYSEAEVGDVVKAVEGVVKLFKRKIYHLPSSIAVSAYKSLVKHLNYHYKKPAVLDNCCGIRYTIFECFFAIRANALYHLGFPNESSFLRYSSFLAVDHRDGDEKLVLEDPNPTTIQNTGSTLPSSSFQPPSGTGPGVTFISLTAACKLVVGSLKREKDWKVLELVLQSLPGVLENKALILSKHGNDIEYLANALCAMVMDKSLNLPDSLKYCPQTPKLSRTDFQAYLYPIFTSLVSYHSHLDSPTQQKIVKSLQQGLVTKCCRSCILALTVCTLEMKDTMHKLLPEVLLSLSKISPKEIIAIPVLEFLSTLIHLPRVFASFVQDQYMTIFAIVLPYTNPFKFNQYTVSLAHHVIAMWFLKCRISYRRQFVSFIIKGLESNVWCPMEEESRRYELEIRNEDSSNRKRSSSLTDQSQKRRERPISGHTQAQRLTSFDSKGAADKSIQIFHQELTETCINFMTRYAFADCSALPTRFSTTSFLIEGGISQSWLIDNRIITITSSGCTQKELKDGVCDKCYVICRKHRSTSEEQSSSKASPSLARSLSVRDSVPSSGTTASALAKRRRHYSAFAVSTSGNQRKSDPTGKPCGEYLDGSEMKEAKDDLHLQQFASTEPIVGHESNISNTSLLGGSSPFISEYSHKAKSEAFLCTCWCAGWAEILIRTPTGNTSWMMRVQNQIGNNNYADIPVKDLASVFLQNIVDPFQPESYFVPSSTTSSTLSSPTHSNHQPLVTSQDSVLAGCGSGGTVSPTNAPSTPTTPDSPETNEQMSRKTPVQRSNSSPEMSSAWKLSHVNIQRDIEEQDEDEAANKSRHEDNVHKQSTSPGESSTVIQHSSGFKGSTSPFRRSYEAIPEEKENTQRSGSLTGSPELSKNIQDILNPINRDRLSTISVMMPARRNLIRRVPSLGGEMGNREGRFGAPPESSSRSGVTPAFVFLQLCAQGIVGKGDKPIPLPPGDSTEKSLRVLDYIPPYETHKIGVVYVGQGQAKTEAAILQNLYGSSRYRDFLQGLGSFIKLQEIDPQKVYIGGLSKDGEDGDFACIWQDDLLQVIFHVSTLMPNKPQDPNGNCKKRHIGNDFVTIVYNNSEEDYDMSTIKAQFLYACVIIQPLEHRTNRVVVKALPILADLVGHTEVKIVSDQNLPTMCRQLALHANLASVIFQKMQSRVSEPYASNWLERLRCIKRLRSRLFPDSGLSSSEELSNNDGLPPITSMKQQLFEDFTKLVEYDSKL